MSFLYHSQSKLRRKKCLLPKVSSSNLKIIKCEKRKKNILTPISLKGENGYK